MAIPKSKASPKRPTTNPWTLGTQVVGWAPAATLNRTSRNASETQATVGGSNALVPIVYGQARVGGKIAALAVDDHLYVAVVWCMGEVDSVVSVTINDEALPSGVTATHYTGTAGQTTNATLAAKISGFADAMPGICYSVFDCRPGKFSGFPRFNAVIKGLKVPLTSGGTPTWSDNPAYLLAALIENSTWGMGRAVDWATVATAASACDALVGGTEKKRLLNIVLDVSQPADTWLQSLRDYAGVFVVPEGASYRLVVDTTGSSVKSFTAANIVEGTMRLSKRGLSDTPTMVEVSYTDTTYAPYREGRYTTPAVTPRRVSRIARPGITRYSEAKRYATERLNEAILNDLTATFESFDDCLSLQVGELIDITHPLGPASKVMRIARLDPVSPGRWRITATEYDAAKYDNTVATGPTTPDTSTIGPNDPPTVTGVVLTEEPYQTENGLYVSRLVATWDELTTWPYVAGYWVDFQVADGGGPDPAYLSVDNQFVTSIYAWSPPVQFEVGLPARVRVYVRSITGVQGANTTAALSGGIQGSAAITNKRILAPFSGTTSAKTYLQNSVANASTTVGTLPSGSGTAAASYLHNSSDPDNSSALQVGITASVAYIGSASNGSGALLPLGLYMGGTQYVQLDTSGRWAWKFSSKSGAPTTSDIPAGYSGIWKDTGTSAVYLYVNDGGSLKKVQLT